MRPLLLAAGYVNLDITAELARVPRFGERVTASKISRSPGGMTANVACAASRLGMEVRFFGSVGSDAGGKEAIAALQSFGVDTREMLVTEGSTTTSLIFLGPEGDRAIVSEPLTFDYRPLKNAIARQNGQPRALHVDGYRLPEALPVLWEARRAGFVVSADLDGVEPTDLTSTLDEISGTVDVAFLNGGLAGTVSADPEEVAGMIIDTGARAVAVTLGDNGTLISDGSSSQHVTAPEVEVVDATGAGDIFAAAFLSEWMEDPDVEKAGRFAVIASSISVQGAGARGRLPDRHEVARLLEPVSSEPGDTVDGRGE